MASKKGRTEKELEALNPALQNPSTSASQKVFSTTLQRAGAIAVAKVASLVKNHPFDGCEDELKNAWERFFKDPIKTDPGCIAKLAVLEALDFLESLDPSPFLTAVHYFQKEPAWGRPVDSAAGLRSRGAFGLARLEHSDFLLHMADLLADEEHPVRQNAAEAIAYRGDPAGASMLQLKIKLGDDEPTVLLACLSGLISLTPEWGIAQAQSLLQGSADYLQEVAGFALGQSRKESAFNLLKQALEEEVVQNRRSILIRSLALHRSDQALELLLDIIASSNVFDAKWAVESLAMRSFEPGLIDRVQEAIRKNPQSERIPFPA